MKSMSTSKKNEARPRIVAFGGGAGMFSLLSGLRLYTEDITAVVTVTDDGGSSGLLRKDLGIPPPGDVRNCLLALSDADPLLKEALNWRFPEGELLGHSLGNLLIAAATLIKGDFGVAVRELHRVLKVAGKVVPSSTRKVSLVAHHADGSSTAGEVRIVSSRRSIHTIELRPDPGRISAEAREAIASADLCVFGPGSLFTSVIPTLLVRGVVEAVRQCPAPRVYVANVMTQPGETDGFALSDHLAAIERHTHPGFVSAVVANTGAFPGPVLRRYREQGAAPVAVDREKCGGVPIHTGALAESGRLLHHNPRRLAAFLLDTFWRRTEHASSAEAGARS